MNEKGHIGWKALEPNSSFVWTFTRNDDGTYKIKHLLTDMYVDSTLVNQLSDQAFMADLPVREQIVTRLNGGGQFNIEFKGAVAPLPPERPSRRCGRKRHCGAMGRRSRLALGVVPA